MSQTLRHKTLPTGQQLLVIRGDLTRAEVDAIVNAANAHLQHGGGVAAAIANRGGPAIQAESQVWVRDHGPVTHDKPAFTSAGALPCRYVIHAVGPVWGEGQEDKKLAAAVSGSLALADQLELQSLALPAISTGIFGFPKQRAAQVILAATLEYFAIHTNSGLRDVRLTLYDQSTIDAFIPVWDSVFSEETLPEDGASLADWPDSSSQISSTSNPKLKWVRSLQGSARKRREAGAFVIEGVRLLEEAYAAGIVPQLVLHSPDLSERGRALLNRLSAASGAIYETTPHALKSASDTQTPQGILAVCSLPAVADHKPEDPILILDQLRDPGNLGTILRTAAALGVGQVILTPKSADPYSPKALRAGMGAQFRTTLLSLEWDALATFLSTSRHQVLLTEAGAGTPFTEIDFRQPTALIIGSEAEGGSAESRSLAHATIQIPMPGGGESLNAAVAAGILLYEIVHQRL